MKDWKKSLIVILSIFGLLLSSYLTVKILNSSGFGFCVTGADCDLVNNSKYSRIFGIPVSLIGFIGYLAILFVSVFNFTKKNRWKILFYLALVGFSFSVYLTFLELYIIKAICSFCVISAILITIILILVFMKRKTMSPKSSIFNSLITAVLVLFAVFITLYSIQSPTKAEVSKLSDNATEAQIQLAKHLQKSNSTMYGSYKCGHCNTQKAMFASAFKYINYVECNNKGPKANPTLCFAKGIKKYPTWEINGKFYQGSFSLDQLSELSGFNPSASQK